MINFIKKNIIKILITNLFILSILILFVIQFKVANIRSQIAKIDSNIASYEDDIKLLDIEWVYLTRPQRLRLLANQHLTNIDYIKLSQIKKESELTSYYIAKYKELKGQDYAYNY